MKPGDYYISQMTDLSNDQLVTLADMMAKTFGQESNCPSVASERGVSYANGKSKWHIGFRANLAEAHGSAIFLVLHGAEGIALCFPPGAMPESPAGKGTQYTQQNRKALQADPSHYKYLQNELAPLQAKAARQRPTNEKRNNLYVSHMCVPEDHRRQGRGRALVEAAQKMAKQHQCDVIVDVDDPENAYFLQRRGFQLVSGCHLPSCGGGEYATWSLKWFYKSN